MKFFIDTANVKEIREAESLGILDGVTTNPSLIAKENKPFKETILQICEIVDGPVSVEVTATDAGGNAELVSSPEVGWLIPMKDRAALTNAIREVVENRDRAAAVGKNARRHVVNGFSKDLRIARLETLYRTILEEKGSGTAARAEARG